MHHQKTISAECMFIGRCIEQRLYAMCQSRCNVEIETYVSVQLIRVIHVPVLFTVSSLAANKTCYCSCASEVPDSKVHRANMGPTWVLSAPDGPHVEHMNFAIRGNSERYGRYGWIDKDTKCNNNNAGSWQWRYNDSNHQPLDWLLNCSFRRRSKKTSELCVTGLCVGIHR